MLRVKTLTTGSLSLEVLITPNSSLSEEVDLLKTVPYSLEVLLYLILLRQSIIAEALY